MFVDILMDNFNFVVYSCFILKNIDSHLQEMMQNDVVDKPGMNVSLTTVNKFLFRIQNLVKKTCDKVKAIHNSELIQ
jgi:hypothetical protein